MLAKRIAALGLALLLGCCWAAATQEDQTAPDASSAAAGEDAAVLPPVETADGGELQLFGAQTMLMCAENGQVLAERDADARVAPASITKLMTALLVFENCPDLKCTTTVSYDACHNLERGSTHIALDTGEQVTLEQMMYAMLIMSANDAANVLAEAVAGTQEAFAEQMTARAAALGCQNTSFANAHGLDDPDHYTSARDMALITQALLAYDRFAQISATDVYTMPPTNKQEEERQFWNKQNILRKNSQFYYADAIAGKNGWTTQAGQTLVTAARRDGVTLIAVTLGANDNKYDKHRDTIAMFDYGYDHFETAQITAAAQASAAAQAGVQTDPTVLTDRMALVPSGDAPMLQVEGGVLAVRAGAREMLRFDLPPAPIVTVSSEGGGKDAAAPLQADDAAFQVNAPLVAGAVAVVLLFLFLCFCMHRRRRVRRQRARIRAMRRQAAVQRAIRERAEFYDDNLPY